jgi:hypothetical protein
MVPKEGDVFLYHGTGPDDGFGEQKPHRCVTVKVTETDIYLIPICSARGYHDKTCELDAKAPGLGLTHKSYVAYWSAKKIPIKGTLSHPICTLPSSILTEIVRGVTNSRETPPWFRDVIAPPAPRRVLAAN